MNLWSDKWYQILQDVERFKLGDPKSFRYLNQSSCFELDGVNDAEEYLATRKAMDVVGISEQEQVCKLFFFCCNLPITCWLLYSNNLSSLSPQDAIFRVVAAILHLGNIEFCKGEDADSSSLKDEQSKFHLQMTSELLMYYMTLLLLQLNSDFCPARNYNLLF